MMGAVAEAGAETEAEAAAIGGGVVWARPTQGSNKAQASTMPIRARKIPVEFGKVLMFFIFGFDGRASGKS